MDGPYRITVRGATSERFRRAFRGLEGDSADGRTVLRGAPPEAPPLEEVLCALGNLGLEVIAVERGDVVTTGSEH